MPKVKNQLSVCVLLSSREAQLLQLSCRGLTDKELQTAMGVSHSRVRKLWDQCRLKYGVRSRVECIVCYVKNGMAEVPQ